MGYTRQEVMGRSSLSLNIWKHAEDRIRLVEGLRKIGSVENLEAQFVRKDGSVVIGLIVLDMMMPGMDGGKTFDRIREIAPDIPVLLSSGYSINGKAKEIIERGCNGFIQKPFNLSELSQKIRRIIKADGIPDPE
jgi:two-component system cell cycle sensor histidine kinase/response regulator CckA